MQKNAGVAKHTCISYILICKDLLTVDSCKKLLAKLLVARLAEKSEHVLLVALNTWLIEWIYTKCVSTHTTCKLKCVEQLTESELINLVDVDLDDRNSTICVCKDSSVHSTLICKINCLACKIVTHKCPVGRGALTPPRRNRAYRGKRCNLFVGDDACIVPRNV